MFLLAPVSAECKQLLLNSSVHQGPLLKAAVPFGGNQQLCRSSSDRCKCITDHHLHHLWLGSQDGIQVQAASTTGK